MKTYKVTLNYHGELHVFHTKTSRPDIAAKNAIYKLAQKLGRDLCYVNLHFNNGDKILVTEVKDDA
uniref:Uncharacterized protein n=1 Tax=viral metagenome TaxID=1070528 RepID=A0A6M3KZH6_9ZZZZ